MARCGTPYCSGTSAPTIDWIEDGEGPGIWVTCPCHCSDECHPITEDEVAGYEDEGIPDEREWNDDHTGPKED